MMKSKTFIEKLIDAAQNHKTLYVMGCFGAPMTAANKTRYTPVSYTHLSQAFGGNIADYKNKVELLPGVGAVKVFPVWNGGGTVKIVLVDSEWSVPSSELVEEVQEAIDPVGTQGTGVGLAPIGHRCV